MSKHYFCLISLFFISNTSIAGTSRYPAELWNCESEEVVVKSSTNELPGIVEKEVAQVIFTVTVKKNPEYFASSENHIFLDPASYNGDDGHRYSISGVSPLNRSFVMGIGKINHKDGVVSGTAWLRLRTPVSIDSKTGKVVDMERSFENLKCTKTGI